MANNEIIIGQNGTHATVPQMEAFFRRLAVYFGELYPTGRVSFSYLTEGAANVVWLIHLYDSNLQRHDASTVLRMRKDIPSTVSMLDLKRDFEERIAPLFAFDQSLLMPVDLIETCPMVIELVNDRLQQLEISSARNALRNGIYHPEFEVEPHAMFMSNLYHGPGKLIEFKPKWLVQSPSAPRDAQRCRTCALNSRRRAKGGSGRGDSGFCPFDLLSSHDAVLSVALRQIWHDESSFEQFLEAFKSRVQPSLRQLQVLQEQHNEVGLDHFLDHDGRDFAVAMALRDCSVVLKVVPSQQSSKLEIPLVKLLDLDLKDTGGGKLEKWARMEGELIEEGWYTTSQHSSIQCAMSMQ